MIEAHRANYFKLRLIPKAQRVKPRPPAPSCVLPALADRIPDPVKAHVEVHTFVSPDRLAHAARAVASAFAEGPEIQGPPTPVGKNPSDEWRAPGTRRVEKGPNACRKWGDR